MEHVNEVLLSGRVAHVEPERTLPSGDALVTLRIVVERPRAARRQGAVVDTIDVACWSGPARRAAARLATGDLVEVTGALRRRFFRTAGGPASRYEVEARRLARRGRGPGPL